LRTRHGSLTRPGKGTESKASSLQGQVPCVVTQTFWTGSFKSSKWCPRTSKNQLKST
jgi:hypothetical protein